MKNSLEKNIIFFSFAILSLTILANTAMDIAVFRKDFIQEKLLRTQTLGTAFKGTIEKILALGVGIQGISGLSEKCGEMVTSAPELTYCVITDVEGKTLYASDQTYSGSFSDIKSSTSINTEKLSPNLLTTAHGTFYDTATPVRSFDGRTVAVIHLGFPQEAVTQKVHGIILRSLTILCLSFLISFALVVFFLKKSIVAPISTLLEGVKRIAKGDFKSPIDQLPMFELNELACKINSMATELEKRDTELKDNYQELSAAHTQLHDSFLQLERLSLNLEKSEEMYKKMLEEAGDAIIIIDSSEMVIIANKRAEEFFGYPAAEIIGQHISGFLLKVRSENIGHLLKMFHEAYDGGYIAEEFTMETSQNEQVVGKLHASCIAIGDQRLLQVIIRDITREHEIVKNLEQSAAGLARLNKMKDSFLGLASHELKTPLTVIIGYSELLLTDMADHLSEPTAEMVQNIATAASRLDSIVKDMIDVSMIDQKQLELQLDLIDLNSLITEAVKESRFFSAIRKQIILTKFAPLLPLIHGDHSRLMQLLTNILGNAIKFTPDGGTITIHTRYRHGNDSPEHIWSDSPLKLSEEYAEIVISDNGIGIDRDDLTRIFDKFYEAGNIEEHSSGKVAFKARGTGLGLSIAKGVVEMHGGVIWAESKGYDPERCPGSAFYVLLPIASKARGKED